MTKSHLKMTTRGIPVFLNPQTKTLLHRRLLEAPSSLFLVVCTTLVHNLFHRCLQESDDAPESFQHQLQWPPPHYNSGQYRIYIKVRFNIGAYWAMFEKCLASLPIKRPPQVQYSPPLPHQWCIGQVWQGDDKESFFPLSTRPDRVQGWQNIKILGIDFSQQDMELNGRAHQHHSQKFIWNIFTLSWNVFYTYVVTGLTDKCEVYTLV